MSRQGFFVAIAFVTSILSVCLDVYGDCQKGCKKNVECFKVGSSNNVCLLVPAMDEPLFIALTIDSQAFTTGSQNVTLYNNCTNQPLNCSAISGFIEIGSCPAVADCFLVGNQQTYHCDPES